MKKTFCLRHIALILGLLVIMMIPMTIGVYASEPGEPEFQPGDTALVVPPDNAEFITLVSYKVRVYYLEPVVITGSSEYGDELYYSFMYDGEEYELPASDFAADMPDYKAEGTIAQEIMDKALTYHLFYGKKTCYDYNRFNSSEPSYQYYCGIYGPQDGAASYTCAPYIEEAINKVMQKHVPTYIFPQGGVEAMRKATVAYNKGYSQQYSYKTVSLENIRPGDVILFDQSGDDGLADHCGIYLGYGDSCHNDICKGDYIHCAYRGEKPNEYIGKYKRVYAYGGVMINHLNTDKQEKIVRIMRPAPDKISPINKTMYASSTNLLYKTMDRAKKYSTTSYDAKVPEGYSMTYLYTTSGASTNVVYLKYNGRYYFTTINSSRLTAQGMANCKSSLSFSSTRYSGTYKKPTVSVSYNGKRLTKGSQYTVSYSNNKNIGKGKVTIKGLHSSSISRSKRYYGSKTLYFTINPATPTNFTLKRLGSTSIKAGWTPVKGSVTGYQIRYSTNSSMSGYKTVTAKGSTARSKTISSLTSGSKYYVKVRAYKIVNGTYYYSSWSSTKGIN